MTIAQNSTEPCTESALTCMEALEAAQAELEAAEAAYESMESPDEESAEYWRTRLVAARARINAAQQTVESAREALAESDEPRTWILREEGYDYAETVASSADEALDEARSNVDRSNYSGEGTIWIDFSVRCELTGEESSGTECLDEDEPECEDGAEHDWRSPHEIVGGCKDNPGVWGNGGGVIIHECCMRCGCARITDTWAQRRDTGEQGLTSVSYEAGKYAAEIPTREDTEVAELDCEELRAGAAYVLAEIREPYDQHRRPSGRAGERAQEVVDLLREVESAAPRRHQAVERACRLALRLTARDDGERRAAKLIIAALGW